jgi:hypothetical protein
MAKDEETRVTVERKGPAFGSGLDELVRSVATAVSAQLPPDDTVGAFVVLIKRTPGGAPRELCGYAGATREEVCAAMVNFLAREPDILQRIFAAAGVDDDVRG